MDSYPGFVGYVRTENEFESLKEIYIYNDYPQDPTMDIAWVEKLFCDEDGMLRIQKYPDTCGFKNIRIRADSKISGYVRTGTL